MKRAIALAAVCAAGVTVSACSDSGPKPNAGGNAREGKASSVGDGLSSTPPAIGDAVTNAAKDAGCAARGFAADGGKSARSHVDGDPTYTLSIPPTSGAHNIIWADWGFYDQPIPYRHQVHNMEHGGVIIHYGSGVNAAGVSALKDLWRQEPAYLMVVPDTSASFPKNGVVVTSWQRWMVCKPFKVSQIAAIKTYRDTFRGAGPENAKGDTRLAQNGGANAPGLPKPALSDPKG
jgi:Protein of unknown function (DUF3105)